MKLSYSAAVETFRNTKMLLTGLVQHQIRRKTKNAYKQCYQKNLEKASWEAYKLLEDNIKIGDIV
jgi:hypothetical protein